MVIFVRNGANQRIGRSEQCVGTRWLAWLHTMRPQVGVYKVASEKQTASGYRGRSGGRSPLYFWGLQLIGFAEHRGWTL